MTVRTNAESDGSASSEPNSRDWLLPAVLVAIAAILLLTIWVVAGIRSSEDDSVAGQLEQWSSCLRSEGANVPLVEALRGGGFRVTVDGSFVEEGIDMDSLRPAMDSCREDAPEGVRKILTLFDGFSSLPFDLFGSGVLDSGEALGTNRR